jgi:GMP synthase (glutamine-hydrolysing)
MKNFYIFKVGETFDATKQSLGDFHNWVESNISSPLHVKTIHILKDEELPKIEETLGVIITGSHSMVTENLEWSLRVEEWIKKANKATIPILGICYGHQLLTKALGGVVADNPKGKEIGTVAVYTASETKSDPLFKNAPSNFEAHVTHMQSALTLPKNAVALASNEHDKHHIVRFGEVIWGVQFHPEFDEKIMHHYIQEQKTELIQMGFDMERLKNSVKKTPYANTLIEEFIQFASSYFSSK